MIDSVVPAALGRDAAQEFYDARVKQATCRRDAWSLQRISLLSRVPAEGGRNHTI